VREKKERKSDKIEKRKEKEGERKRGRKRKREREIWFVRAREPARAIIRV